MSVRSQPVAGAEADLNVGGYWDVVVVREGGIVYVEARVGVFTAVVMSPLNLSQLRTTAVLRDDLRLIRAWGLIVSKQWTWNIKLQGEILLDHFLLHRGTAVRRCGAVLHDVSWGGKVWAIREVSLRQGLCLSAVDNPVATVVTLQGTGHCTTGEGHFRVINQGRRQPTSVDHQGAYKQNFDELLHVKVEMFLSPLSPG